MLASPFVVGVIATHPVWSQVLLLITWFVGYFAFNAISLWLKASRRPRYWPPARAYLIAAAVCGLFTVAVVPGIARWAPLFVPLVAIALVEAHHRRDRSMVSGLSTVIAAALLTYVVMWLAGPLDVRLASYLVLAQLAYFVGVVLYVKTVIRERGHTSYLVASICWHVLCTLVAGLTGHLWLATAFLVLTVRAVCIPRTALRPKQVGMLEIPTQLLVTCAMLL